MDQQAFDRLTRLFSQSRSRRESIGALLGVAIGGLAAHAAGAKSGGKRHGRGGKDDGGRGHDSGNAKRKAARSEQVPARCYAGRSCVLGKGNNNASCDFSGMDLSGKNLSGSNLSKATFTWAVLKNANLSKSTFSETCFVDADLTDANLKGSNTAGAIFCRTVMPDGSINNSGCNRGTSCCPTCVPLGEQRCSLGGSCCGAGVCRTNQGGQGLCVCPNGSKNCDGTCRDVQSDDNNCGQCGQQCGTNQTCINGNCTCNPGTIACNGQCVLGNCCGGSTGVSCQSGETCCAPNGCKDLKQDTANCGACGVPCDDTKADGCVDGVCVCGSGDVCREGTTCSGGECVCEDGTIFCENKCQTCAPPSGEVGTLQAIAGAFCCAGDFCSCGGQCCADRCFWTEDTNHVIVDEFCCTGPGKVYCVSADGRDEACCAGNDPSVCDACLIGETGGRFGSYRRPGSR